MTEQDTILDLPLFKRTILTLEDVIQAYGDDKENDYIRDAIIKRFEYCYDLSTKFIRRHLSIVVDSPSTIKEMSFPTMIREAYNKGLLKNSWDVWYTYRNNRNRTSHGYNETSAIEIANEVSQFYEEICYLEQKLIDYHESTC